MWKQAFAATARLASSRWRFSVSTAVGSELRRSVEEHFREVSNITPPSKKKLIPPPPYSVVEGALDRSEGPVLRRAYGEEEISISVRRRAFVIPSRGGGNEDEVDRGHDFISELFLYVNVSRPGRSNSLLFLCVLYPDAVGIHSVCLISKQTPDLSQGRVFLALDQQLRDAFCIYLEERGVSKRLFPFLQSWLYLKDHHNIMNWFRKVSDFINDIKPT
ncbi:uncharacterized protein LOC135628420 [Musa acuminata AAA Group]|uniref:uncharacterized protein LOC135628420 n=1 Tax=Musa acuminata AAA Group TaxID=214697 RepID=UPI0031E084C9